MEKSKGLCRQIVLPTAQDALVLQRLSDSFFAGIRGKTPSKAAYFEPDSFTFDVSGRRSRGYGSFAAWLHFQNKVKEICHANNYVIITDVANYYDHIGHGSLRNIVSSNIEVKEAVFDLLLNVLNSMNWAPDYLPNTQIGLPQIDLDAPRVLAHSFLFDLDRYAERVAPGDFTRYMDDINFGTNSISQAKEIVRDVDLVLHARQVRLNSGKTFILTTNEAQLFFRFSEHQRLDRLQKIIEVMPKGTGLHQTAAAAVSKLLQAGYRTGQFDSGHGDKILKRLLTLSRISGRPVSARILSDILRRRPTCRDAALAYIGALPAHATNVALISDFVKSPETIDDVAPLLAATTLVSMQAKNKRAILRYLLPTTEKLQMGGPHRLYAALWILSKYGNERELLDAMMISARRFTSNYELGRLAGGLFPIFYATSFFEEYRSVVQNSSQSHNVAYLFHSQLATQPRLATSLQRFLMAKNRSLPNQITHQKLMMILTALKSPNLSDEYKVGLVNAHPSAWLDAFYRQQAVKAVPKSLANLIRNAAGPK